MIETSTNTVGSYSTVSHISNWFSLRFSLDLRRLVFSLCQKIFGSLLPHKTIPGFHSYHAKCWKKLSTPIQVLYSLSRPESSGKVRFLRKSGTSCSSHSMPICTIGSLISATSSFQWGKFFGFSFPFLSFCAHGDMIIINTSFYRLRAFHLSSCYLCRIYKYQSPQDYQVVFLLRGY